jgi:hypothetical protein
MLTLIGKALLFPTLSLLSTERGERLTELAIRESWTGYMLVRHMSDVRKQSAPLPALSFVEAWMPLHIPAAFSIHHVSYIRFQSVQNTIERSSDD